MRQGTEPRFSPHKMEALRCVFLERREILQSQVRVNKTAISRETGGDVGDAAQNNLETEVAATVAQMRLGTLEQIESALTRIDNGTYGFCGTCGRTLPSTRLEAMPFAERCRDCQERQEQTGEQHSSSSSVYA